MDNECPDFNYKIILVGDARVGKTCIINRFVNDEFNEKEKRSKQIQIQKKTMAIDGTKKYAQLHIWDTLG